MNNQNAKASRRDHKPKGPSKCGAFGAGATGAWVGLCVNAAGLAGWIGRGDREDQLTRGGVGGKGRLAQHWSF